MPNKQRKIPMRMCVGCREMKEKKALLRVVRLADGGAAIDRTGKAPGRGAYICPSGECLKKAINPWVLTLDIDTTDVGTSAEDEFHTFKGCGERDGGSIDCGCDAVEVTFHIGFLALEEDLKCTLDYES